VLDKDRLLWYNKNAVDKADLVRLRMERSRQLRKGDKRAEDYISLEDLSAFVSTDALASVLFCRFDKSSKVWYSTRRFEESTLTTEER